MHLDDFEHLLKASIGLDAGSVGESSIERAVQERLSACALPDRHAYWERVRSSGTELQALIEEVIVPETWFFRDREAFAVLAGIGHEKWLRASADGVLRLLSLPCSSGEEPYSMAMALLDASIPADRFRIDAVDVSARAIAQAERAVYGRNSFRGQDLAFRDRHFEATALGYRPNDSVRHQVQFRQGNLLAADLLPGLDLYDVIFCRNLLIYFDRATQDRAVGVLQRLLTSNGTLFVAPSETAFAARPRLRICEDSAGVCVSQIGRRLRRSGSRPFARSRARRSSRSHRRPRAASRSSRPPGRR